MRIRLTGWLADFSVSLKLVLGAGNSPVQSIFICGGTTVDRESRMQSYINTYLGSLEKDRLIEW